MRLVPQEYKNEDFYIALIDRNLGNIIPKEEITESLCQKMIEKIHIHLSMFQMV